MKLTLHLSIAKYAKLLILLILLLGCNVIVAQVEIASQRFNNGNPNYQYTVADKDGIFAPSSQTITTHVGTDNWDYTASTSEGIIRVVNTDITNPASDLYCLELKNYWDDEPTIEFVEKNITNYVNVTFSIAYQSLGDPDNNEDLVLEYSYLDGGNWVDTTVILVEGENPIDVFGFQVEPDIRMFNTNFPTPNPFIVSIPDTATAFRATISSDFLNGANGNDNYYIDDVILSGDPTTAAPIANCQGDFSVSLDQNDTATITAADIDNGSSVSVGTMTLSIDKSEFTCDDLGPNVITLTVDDGTQTSTCTTTVTVNSYNGPLIAPNLPSVSAFCSYDAPTPADISYQCNTITPTTTDATSFNTPGNYTITWLYYDSVSGNSDTSVQSITINNLTAPNNVTVSNIGPDTATITWDQQTGVDSYEVLYKKDGLINWQSVVTTDNTVVLTGLDQLTDYNFQINANCGSSTISNSIDNFTTLGHSYCTPSVGNNSNRVYVRTVNVGTINNTEGREPGGYDDNTHLSTVLYKNESHPFNITFWNRNYYNIGHAIWIDFNGDGDFEDAGEMVWNNNGNLSNVGQFQAHNPSIFIPSFAVTGLTRMRVAVRQNGVPDNPCNDDNWNGSRGEFEDYTLDLQIRPDSPQEIDVTGNGTLIVDGAGVAELDPNNNTDFGEYDVYEVPMVKTYKITNNGADPLTLTGNPLVTFINNTGDFTITQPSISYLAIGESTTFTITFDPVTVGTKTATVRILNDDVDYGETEEDYTFLIQGEAVKTFPDTDGDGVPDNVDLDDDNDGILDSTEDNTCKTYSYATQVETIFLNETFGTGYDRATISEVNAGASTTYCFEDGTATCGGSNNLNDGSYTLYYQTSNGDGINQTPYGDVASWADSDWYVGLDHTPDNIDGAEPGRMLIVNADYDPGIFYQATINGVTPGVEVTYGFSVINLMRTDHPNIANKKKPQVAIAVYDPNGSLIALESSGLIEPTDASNPAGDWITLETTFVSTSSQFTIQLINDQDGGDGNDLAIDDIYVKQILCDLDGDGVPDSVDLDNDNDGIPNIVELGLSDGDKDATLFGDGWIDANGNGVHDAYEGGATQIDTDGDGIPNFMDLDSDNDGIFDAVEFDGFGDIDVNGDGVGEGDDSYSGVSNDTSDGDGLLAIVDTNDDDADEFDHGSSGYPDALDTDGDNIPDYLDVDSNNDGVNDIEMFVYSHLDTNNDGQIDGVADADNDGLLDVFDTNDNGYGSPRDLDNSYALYFDGRNDYVEEDAVINNWTSASLMAWIKIEPSSFGKRVIVGQDNFRLEVESNGNISAKVNANTYNSGVSVESDIWVHVAAIYDGLNGNLSILINGEVVNQNTSVIGNLLNDTSSFTIGRASNTDSNYFKGEIDEVRLFNEAVTVDQLQKMVYQELDENQGFNSGKIIPKEISATFNSSLIRYYKMDAYKDDILDNKVTVAIDQFVGAKMYNIKDIYLQTAPLPYQTKQAGEWTMSNTWLHGNVWDITTNNQIKDWSIVSIKNNVITANSVTNLGLFIDNNKTLTVSGDNQINNTWYLELNGTLDLQNDSQLVQGLTSDLVTSATGKILRRQEGQSNVYRYNYWSSPVGAQTATTLIDENTSTNNPNNTAFTLNTLKDANGNLVSFTNGYHQDGSISTYWLYTYQNATSYWNWQGFDQNTPIATGLGYTQKGGGTLDSYIFEGKPNNGTIQLSANDVGGAGSDAGSTKTEYLVGNPYASAIDAHQFIDDNAGVISGSLYLWEQWAGDSHVLAEYQGGYATLNKLGKVRAYQFIGIDNNAVGSQGGIKTPTRYIPVAQSFMVEVTGTGAIEFNNGQRIFKTEAAGESVFFRQNNTAVTSAAPEVAFQKIKLEFTNTNGLGREIVLGFSDQTSDAFDYGYDAIATETFVNDLTMPLDNQQSNIQAFSSITSDKVIDLNFKSDGNSTYTIKATSFDNVPMDQSVYLLDNLNGTYHDLKSGLDYNFTSVAGTFNDRFDVVFQTENTLSTVEFSSENTVIYYNNNLDQLFVKQLKEEVKYVQLINMLGQAVYKNQNIKNYQIENGIKISGLSAGMYVVSIKTETNKTIDKKIMIK